MNDDNESRCFIYALHHSNSTRVYVGKTAKGMRRPREHAHPSHLKKYAHLPRSKWIAALQRRGLEPRIVILETSTHVENLDEAERFYIEYFRSIGMSLLNLTDGGDGIHGYRHSDKACARMSATRKVSAKSPEARERLARQSRAYWADPEAREKKRVERTGKKHDATTRAKISAAHKGKLKSGEHRANLSMAASTTMKLRWQNPQYRARQIEAATLRAADPTLRKKISDATKLALAKRRGEDPQ